MKEQFTTESILSDLSIYIRYSNLKNDSVDHLTESYIWFSMFHKKYHLELTAGNLVNANSIDYYNVLPLPLFCSPSSYLRFLRIS